MFAEHAFSHPLAGDEALNVIGQRYYLADSWHWPPLMAKNLIPPEGVNVAFMDAIPLLLVPLKVVRGILPTGFHIVFLWLGICWLLQPIAAVFALRSAGERRFLPGVAVAVLSISVPTLLYRFGHAALCSHFLILIALGLYFQIVNREHRKPLVQALLLIIAALFIHPYLMYMVIAVLLAAPVTLLVRRDRRWIPVAIALVGAVALTGVLALLMGYGRALPLCGLGYYSMNLFSPVYPFGSSLLKGFEKPINATGGQGEGYQYLGLGVLLLVLVVEFCLGYREKLRVIARHSGIVIVCLVLTLLALSNKVYAGHHLIFSVKAPGILEQFRATGRFFWPVTYLLIIGGTVLLVRYLPRRAAIAIMALVTLLQFAETQDMRRWMRHTILTPDTWVLDTGHLRPLLAKHTELSIWPKFNCGANHLAPPFLQLGQLASEVALPVDTMYVGRLTAPVDCKVPTSPIVVPAGELLVFLPESPPAMELLVEDWQSICRKIGVLVACSQQLRGISDLATIAPALTPSNQMVSVAAGAPGLPALGIGWSNPEPWGVWSDGPKAQLIVEPEDPAKKPTKLVVRARSLSAPPAKAQRVTVIINGKEAAVWDVVEGKDDEYTASIPPGFAPFDPIAIEFQIQHPISPAELGAGNDGRKLGFGLVSFRLETQGNTTPATSVRHSVAHR